MENSILIIAILLKTLQLLSIAFRLNSNLWTLYILSSTCSLALYLGNYTYLLFSENIIFLWKLYLIPCPKSGLKFPSICFQSVLSIYPITLHFLFLLWVNSIPLNTKAYNSLSSMFQQKRSPEECTQSILSKLN